MKHFIHVLAHRAESWVHAGYCGALWLEGHTLYATIGGILGLIVLLNIISEHWE
jgi:hypothetical protein